MYTGDGYDVNRIDDIIIGKTTRQDVEKLLGKPYAVAKKVQENIVIYTYKAIRARGLAIPFILSVGKTAERGNQLSVAFDGASGKVLNVEILDIGKN